MRSLTPLPIAALLLASAAHAQLVYNSDDAGNLDNWFFDTNAGTNTGPLWDTQGPWGLADDDTNGVMYMADGSTLYSWAYNDNNPPTAIGTVTDTGTNTTFSPLGLAYDSGTLTGFTGLVASMDGLYAIDVVAATATLTYGFQNGSGDHGGLDVDPATGLFYTSNDLTGYVDSFGTAGRGIVEVDTVNMTETIIAPYPGAETDIDGLAFDPSGVVWLIEDEPAPLHNYDLGTQMYDSNPPMNAILASEVFSAGTWSDVFVPTAGPPGTNYCGPAVANSTGSSGTITATGSNVVADDDVTLIAENLPPNEFGYFLNSMTQSFIFPVPNSQGALCLGGQLGRYNGQPFNSGAGGTGQLVLDLANTPTPTGPVAIQAGETWNFTCWYRDMNPGTTSNFTDGFSVAFQ